GEQRPALAPIASHLTEGVRESRPDGENRDHLDQVAERGWILVRMRSVGVEEPATIGAQFFDYFLRSDGALGDNLWGAFQGLGMDIRAQILRDTLPDEDQREHDRQRQQDPQSGANQIEPEISKGPRRAPHETA